MDYKVTALLAGVERGDYPVVPEPIPTLIKARDNMDALAKQGAPVYDGAIVGQLHEQLMETGELPSDWSQQLDDAARAKEAASLYWSLVNGFEDTWQDRVRQEVPLVADAMLDGLRTEMDKAIDRLNTNYQRLGHLDLDNPDGRTMAAATKDFLAAFTEMVETTEHYRRIRSAQVNLYAALYPVPGSSVRSVTWAMLRRSGILDVREPSKDWAVDDMPPRAGVQAVVTRGDVWMPTYTELLDATEGDRLFGTPTTERPSITRKQYKDGLLQHL